MRRPETFRLSGTGACREAANRARSGNPIIIKPHSEKAGWYEVFDKTDERLGVLSNKHIVAHELAAGRILLHASVNCINHKQSSGEISITVRIITGEPGEVHRDWKPSPDHILSPDMSSDIAGMTFTTCATFRGYKVPLWATSRYQEAIGGCKLGDRVSLQPETENEEDDRAVAVFAHGKKIGYLPDSGWLKGPIIDQGVAVTAVIRLMPPVSYDRRGVILDMAW